MATNTDLEQTTLLAASSDPLEAVMSVPDLRRIVYGRQTQYAAGATTSVTDVELAALRAASVDPNKDARSLADLRRVARGG